MAKYLAWSNKNITDFSDKNINDLYNRGFLFTREGKGAMYETRSVRIDLDRFKLSSENRRVLRKTEDLRMKIENIPYLDYSWKIGKLGKDFYETKFGEGVFSANKIKELMTDGEKSNFNRVIVYSAPVILSETKNPLKNGEKGSFACAQDDKTMRVGHCICLETNEILHYCYPFYILDTKYKILNTGLGMMTRAVVWAQESGKKYIYLGSAKDAKALYKFQFAGVEWWDGEIWRSDVEDLKKILI